MWPALAAALGERRGALPRAAADGRGRARFAPHPVHDRRAAGRGRAAAAARRAAQLPPHRAARRGRRLHRRSGRVPPPHPADRRLQRGRRADPRLSDHLARLPVHLPADPAVRGRVDDRRPASDRRRRADLRPRRDRGARDHRRGRPRALAACPGAAGRLPAGGRDHRDHRPGRGGRDLPRSRRAGAPVPPGRGREPAQRRDRDRDLHGAARHPDHRPGGSARRGGPDLPDLLPRRRAGRLPRRPRLDDAGAVAAQFAARRDDPDAGPAVRRVYPERALFRSLGRDRRGHGGSRGQRPGAQAAGAGEPGASCTTSGSSCRSGPARWCSSWRRSWCRA